MIGLFFFSFFFVLFERVLGNSTLGNVHMRLVIIPGSKKNNNHSRISQDYIILHITLPFSDLPMFIPKLEVYHAIIVFGHCKPAGGGILSTKVYPGTCC